MANLTSKELTGLTDELGAEQILVQKYRIYAQAATDPQIKTKCEQLSAQHQQHFDQLFAQLN